MPDQAQTRRILSSYFPRQNTSGTDAAPVLLPIAGADQLGFSRSERFLIGARSDRFMTAWDPAAGKQIAQTNIATFRATRSFAIDHEENTVALGFYSGQVELWRFTGNDASQFRS